MKIEKLKNKIIPLTKQKEVKQNYLKKRSSHLQIRKQLEAHYYFPQDSEWAIEGNKVYIVQTRPITTIEATSKASTYA